MQVGTYNKYLPMDQKIKTPQSNTKIIGVVIIAFLFVAAGIGIAMSPEMFSNDILGIYNLNFIRGVGISGVIFFGISGFIGIKQIVDKNKR